MKLNRLFILCAAFVCGVMVQSCCCNQSPIAGENYKFENGMIVFDEPQRAIPPGQSAVLYDGDTLIGGGIIDSAHQ